MNSSQLIGLAVLIGIFGYPLLTELLAANRRRKDRKASKKLARYRHF